MRAEIVAERLAEHLAPGLSATVAERLLASPRLCERVRSWALGDLRALDDLPAADRAVAGLDPAGLVRTASLAGAVWHAGRVRGLIVAADVQSFLAAHGAEARDAALRLGHLAPGSVSDDLPLIEAVATDGKACLTAWIDQMPPPAAVLVRLTLDPAQEGAPDEAHRAHGPDILRAVVAAAP